jgi:hypothetical protein
MNDRASAGGGRRVLEFAGLPGCGKSSVVRELVAAVPGAQAAARLKFGPRDAVEHPIAVARALAPWRPARSSWSDARAFRDVVRRRVSQDISASVVARRARYLLLEEGITHYVWRRRFLDARFDQEPWEPFLRVPYPLLVLDVDVERLRSRIMTKQARGRINTELEALAPDTLRWRAAVELYERTLEAAASVREVLRIDASDDLAATTRRVRQVLITTDELL